MVALLRGRRHGLEISLADRDLAEAFEELQARLGERPAFYRGSAATAALGGNVVTGEQLERLRAILAAAQIELVAASGSASIQPAVVAAGLRFEAAAEPAADAELQRRRALRVRRDVRLSENARSLVADFAGARADIAERRKRGEASVRKLDRQPAVAAAAVPDAVVVAPPPAAGGAWYHAGTLRGGQTLHHDGTIVVVGDVNPGAELVATGDVVVFGRLAGVAHAGAGGDAEARVFALELVPTQLRIGAFIAADSPRRTRRNGPPVAEAAVVRDGRIAIVAFDRLQARAAGAPS